MKSENRVAGQVMANVVKRLKASGLSKASIETAIDAVKGRAAQRRELKLTKAVRSQIAAYVQENGPIVISGRKSLKIYSLESYRAVLAASSRSAKKHRPWEKNGHGKKVTSPAATEEPK